MSRYTLTAHDPRSTVVVGWDTPLATFFCQVFDTRLDADEETACVLWEGTQVGALVSVEEVQACLTPFATLPGALCAQLRQAQAQAPSRRPAPATLLRLRSSRADRGGASC
jgi:hypothetical protein